MNNTKSKWELFIVTYQLPKFGSNGKEFDDQEWHLTVGTQGGSADASAACKQYHKGCKVLGVVSRLEELAGVKIAKPTTKTTKKKGSK